MAELDLNQDTIRQRRNLVITTIFIIFIKLANVSFGENLTFFGASLYIGKPELIYDALLIFQGYFLWRFYQYFTTDQAYRALVKQFQTHMENSTRSKLVELICEPRGLKSLSGGDYQYSNLTQKDFFTYSINASSFQRYNIATEETESDEFVAEISSIKLEAYRLAYFIGYICKARILTDYFVPYVLVAYSVFLQFS